jgi:hypothetical protein
MTFTHNIKFFQSDSSTMPTNNNAQGVKLNDVVTGENNFLTWTEVEFHTIW